MPSGGGAHLGSREFLASRPVRGDTLHTIPGFRRKGLERFHRNGATAGIDAQHAAKLRRLLSLRDIASGPDDLRLPGARLNERKGGRKGQWAVRVSGNWRLVFAFQDGDAADVDDLDYH